MYFQSLMAAAYGLSAIQLSSASPIALPQGTGSGADSCTTEALTADTWKSLNIDTFLKDWTAANVTAATTNNVQALASSFGAPNFFCGLDNFCNAGQPCLPVTTPAWYAMVAIQNWNSYMNSINTAINFASSIAALSLPAIVQDFYPKPEDNITPLKNIAKIFTSVLSIVPFTGAVATVAGDVGKTITFLTGELKVPTEPDRFLAWSDLSNSLGAVVTDYQAAVSNSLKATLDAKVNETNGINSILSGGAFLGISQNFTQADLQLNIIDSINVHAISLVLQAQKIFIYRFPNGCTNEDDDPYKLCVAGSDAEGGDSGYTMLKSDSDANAVPQIDFTKLLLEKYGMTKEQFLVGPAACFDANGKKQLADPFNDILPIDKTTQCLFNLQVCGQGDAGWKDNTGIVDNCRIQGLDI